MDGEAIHAEGATARRVELILQEIESLPTLSSVAVRLLEVTADDDAEAQEVIGLVESDPSLSSKVLGLCRSHDRGRASRVTTIERAVLLLGFESVRWAVLSAQVFDVIDGVASRGGEVRGGHRAFDREGFWMHSLGVAAASARIASRAPSRTVPFKEGEAFTAGLLHDIGQLVLHVILPESFDRVCRMAETHAVSLERACRQVIGLDPYTAGKRVVEHWGLPRPLVDVVWLSGQPYDALPQVPHRGLIAVVSLADALVRHHYITPGAHATVTSDLGALCAPLGIKEEELEAIAGDLHTEVAERAAALGMNVENDLEVLLRSIIRANEALARANRGMRQRERVAQRQAGVLGAIERFHESLPRDGSEAEVLGKIGLSISELLSVQAAGALYRSTERDGWRMVRFTGDGRPFDSRLVEPPREATGVISVVTDMRTTAPASAVLPWVGQFIGEEEDAGQLRLLPLSSGAYGCVAVLLLRTAADFIYEGRELEGLVQCWRGAFEGAVQRQSALSLSELLAEANRRVLDVQEALGRSQAMATLGEVAAGAAHEMNNPLTVISGRSQLLANRLSEPGLRDMALEIARQAHQLSDIITALRAFAEPTKPNIRTVNLADLVVRVVQEYGPGERREPRVNMVLATETPMAELDPDLIGPALGELVRNAVESKGAKHIELRVQTDPLDGRLKLEVRDDGAGLSEHALRHAFDPFFSAKPAGRQPGLGLACARRFVEAHGGRIALVNGAGGGAIATMWLGGGREEDREDREAA